MTFPLFARFQFTFALVKLGSECSLPAPQPELQPIPGISRFIRHPANFHQGFSGRDKQISFTETKLDTGINKGKAVPALGGPKKGP